MQRFDIKIPTWKIKKPGSKRKLSFSEEFLFIILVRLKTGMLLLDLSERFDESESLISKTFTTWIIFFYHELPLYFLYKN